MGFHVRKSCHCGIATYINEMQCTEFKRTGLWVTSDKDGSRWLGVSPDGIVDNDTVVEIKCPYIEGNPFPYRKVPIFSFLSAN